MRVLRNTVLMAGLLLLAAACNDTHDPKEPNPPAPPAPVNHAPVANAGADQSGLTGDSLTLSASASTDPDADALTYSWAITTGPSGAVLANPTAMAAGFQASTAGAYVVSVTVKDPSSASSVDSLNITITEPVVPPPPTGLNIRGLPPTLELGAEVVLGLELPAPAGAGGTQLSVLSSNPAAITVPATVVVPEGTTAVALQIAPAAIGSARITLSGTGFAAVSADTEVGPDALDLSISGGLSSPIVGQPASTITVTLENPAPAGGTSAALTLSNARATLGVATVNFAAGATTATTTLTPNSQGPVIVTAKLAGVTSSDSLRVLISGALASATKSSESLIDEKLEAGDITPEQALIYRVYAAFGAGELPAIYRGNDTNRLDSGALREAAGKFATMSSSAQLAVGKYLFPPVYAGSWGADLTGDAANAGTGKAGTATSARAATATANVSCYETLAGMPHTDTLQNWRWLNTRSFKLWYPLVVSGRNASFNLYTAEQAYQLALDVSITIQQDYDKLVAVFGTPPMSDGNQKCNGGDDRIDIYMGSVGLGPRAQVMSYLPGKCARPGFMWIGPDRIYNLKDARNIVAHELVHLFQLRIARSDCDDFRYSGFDEMHAMWAIDHLHPDDDWEHIYALHGGYFDSYEFRETPLLTSSLSFDNCNGYCDYPFFEWLDRKYGSTAVKTTLEAGASVNPARSFEVGLAGIGGGLDVLWPKFALAMYNDYTNHVQDEWDHWEQQVGASLKKSYIDDEQKFLNATLNGATQRKMQSELTRTHIGSLEPMTFDYLSIRFPDANVTSIRLEHKGQTLHNLYPHFRLQAIQKIDGQWREAEDWSGEDEITFCRDKKAVRVEEIVLVYSNSYSGDVVFDSTPPSRLNLMDTDAKLPQLTISNVTCMPWHGTSSVNIFDTHGGVIHQSAQVEFKKFVVEGDEPDADDDLPIRFFVVERGTAHVDGTTIDAIGCVQTTAPVDGPIDELEGRLQINTTSRVVTGHGLSTIDGSSHTLQCGDAPPIVAPGPAVSNWLVLPQAGWLLGDDGRTFEGSFTDTNSVTGVRTESEWHFDAKREE
jgi:hypothetical protein